LHGKNKYKDQGGSAEMVNPSGILSGMGKIGHFFDRISRRRTIESLILLILSFSLLCASGIHDLIKAHKDGDQLHLYLGGGLVAMSLFAIMWISLLIRAVARRSSAELRS
jgi:hypothetical protein